MKKLLFLIFVTCFAFGCNVPTNQTNQTNSPSPKPTIDVSNVQTLPPNDEELKKVGGGTPTPQKIEKTDTSACLKSTRDDLMVDEKQTFAINFKPFEGACFVTFHDPEFDNPPLGSQFFIYQNGREVFEFPEQFGMGNATCWVDAVAFEDFNGDQLKDIGIIGKCGAKAKAYNENMVYLNNGTEFVTNADSNAELLDFSKVSQIRDFVKKNPKMFVP